MDIVHSHKISKIDKSMETKSGLAVTCSWVWGSASKWRATGRACGVYYQSGQMF